MCPDGLTGGLWLRTTATQAKLSHCQFKFAPVLDESSVAQFSDCLFERSGGEYSLSTVNGANPLNYCTVGGNSTGDGIRAGKKTLTGCVAENNGGMGLQGGTLSGCTAQNNGSAGMTATMLATGCTAIGNGYYGIMSNNRVENCLASNNLKTGISAWSDVTHSIAISNAIGFETGSTISYCQAKGNTDYGISVVGTADHCIAENNGKAGLGCANLNRQHEFHRLHDPWQWGEREPHR